MVEIPCSSWILSQSVDRAWNASSTPAWQLGSQEFPEPTAMGDLETCPCVAKPILGP